MIPIQMQEVQSSNIAAAGYDAPSSTLAVKFTGGSDKTYHYLGVPPEIGKGMLEAESVGRFFAKEVRGVFEHQVVDDRDAI